jgi:hypothetical protein
MYVYVDTTVYACNYFSIHRVSYATGFKKNCVVGMQRYYLQGKLPPVGKYDKANYSFGMHVSDPTV